MILDTLTTFALATALNTGGAGTYLLGDVMDLGTPNGPTAIYTSTTFRDLGASADPLFLVIAIDTAVTSAGAATIQFILASDAQAAIATDGSASQHYASAAIAKATLVAGYRVAAFQLPRDGGVPYERYLGILQVTGTAAATAGAASAFLTRDANAWKAYTNGVQV